LTLTMTWTGELTAAFRRDLTPEAAGSMAVGEDVERSLELVLRRGRTAWPDLNVEPGTFMAFLAQRIKTGARERALLDFPHAEDLYLSCACISALPGALRVFEDLHFKNLPSHLAQLTPTRDILEEVEQTLRAKLFVAMEGAQPGLVAYAGRGPLGAWFRVTALHTALKLLRAEMNELRLEARAVVEPPPADPEHELVRARTRAELEETLRDVLSQLPARERSLLRLHFVNGSTLEELTRAFNVSRATVVRWIANARQSVLQETQRRMVERLKLSPSELSSTFRITRSDWALSLESVMKSKSRG
jgi:RNA polymerase sigma-70 factor, ECF subfamily